MEYKKQCNDEYMYVCMYVCKFNSSRYSLRVSMHLKHKNKKQERKRENLYIIMFSENFDWPDIASLALEPSCTWHTGLS